MTPTSATIALALGLVACNPRAAQVQPVATRASLVSAGPDTTVTEQSGRMNPNNPLVEFDVLTFRSHGTLIGVCVFGVAADSTTVAFPGSLGIDCARPFEEWSTKRHPGAPSR